MLTLTLPEVVVPLTWFYGRITQTTHYQRKEANWFLFIHLVLLFLSLISFFQTLMSASISFKEFPFTISAVKFSVPQGDRRGPNILYSSLRSKTFLFELSDNVLFTNTTPNFVDLPYFTIHTNDHHISFAPTRYSTSMENPTRKFLLSKFIDKFFELQSVIPISKQKRFFPIILRNLLN